MLDLPAAAPVPARRRAAPRSTAAKPVMEFHVSFAAACAVSALLWAGMIWGLSTLG